MWASPRRPDPLNGRTHGRWLPAILVGGLILLAGVSGVSAAPSTKQSSSGRNEEILRAQLFLDGSAFKPGAIDGKWGEFMRKALEGYLRSQGKTERLSDKAPEHFDLPLDSARPTLVRYEFSPEDQTFIGVAPKALAAQAKQKSLPYQSFLELAGEKFHCRVDFLKQINPGFDWSKAKPGDSVEVPNVVSPFNVQDAVELKTKTELAEKADKLKTEKQKAPNEQYSISVSVADRILSLHQNGNLVGSYPITAGSTALPAPIGEWFVKGVVWMPTFRWDEAILHGSHRSNNFHQLPSGPNDPVGILWMELNHKGSGIHGTDTPGTIGRATSHGCIRLSNWDALDLGTKVLPGVHVTIRQASDPLSSAGAK